MHAPTPPRHAAAPPGRSGFTLLEVLLAIAIFSICMSAIYAAFNTTSRAFEGGRRSSEVTQTARFTIDYDQRFLALERMLQSQSDLDLSALDSVVDSLLGARPKRDDDDEADREGEPRYVGLKYDLQFAGDDGGEVDQLRFAHFLPSDGTFDNSFLGAERVH